MLESIINLHILLFTGAACVVQTAAQVYPYNDTNCQYDNNTIRCYNLHAIPPLKTGSDVIAFTSIEFQSGNITSVPSNSLPPGLRSIMFVGHPVTDISDNAFNTSATDLQELSITGAQFSELPRALLKLANLTMLDIADTPIEDWNETILQHIATSVTDLQLNNVNLSAWPRWVSYFHALSTLDLSRNSLKSVPSDAFMFFNNTLVSLSLNSAGLNHLPQALSTLPNLAYLHLNDNNISDVYNTDKPIALPQLLMLYMESNKLTTILDFSHMTSLRSVYLNNNNISDPTSGSFPSSLVAVLLAGNNLTSVPKVVANILQQAVVNLSHNQVTVTEPGDFPALVTSLDLSFNRLTVINDTVFRNLTTLISLYLSNNPVSTISESAFSDLPMLYKLDFSFTNLREVPIALASLTLPSLSIHMEDIHSLSCPCPPPGELTAWFSTSYTIYGKCNNGQAISSYLQNDCPKQITTDIPTTTTHSYAPALEYSFVCRYGTMLLLLALRFCCY